jgi:hypothetical protein
MFKDWFLMYYPFAVKNLKKYNYKPKTSGTPGICAIIGPICQENLITISVKIRIVTITLIFNTHLETAEKDLGAIQIIRDRPPSPRVTFGDISATPSPLCVT